MRGKGPGRAAGGCGGASPPACRWREKGRGIETYLGETERARVHRAEMPKTHFRAKSRIIVMRRQMIEMLSPTLETICSGRFGGCWGDNQSVRHYIVGCKLTGAGPDTILLGCKLTGAGPDTICWV